MSLVAVAESSYMLELFREFYAELSHLKARALSGRGSDVEQVFLSLRDFLTRRELDAGRRLEAEGQSRLFREALYVMVVLADEVLLNAAWSGRAAWRDTLLENEFFQSCIAGDEFFEKVDAFLKLREGSNVELGMLYLYALALGFRGRYRDSGSEEPREIATYRRRLYVAISGRKPELFEQDELFPGTMAEAVDESPRSPLPDIRRWVVVAGSVLVVYLIISHAVWHQGTSELFRLTDCVLNPNSCPEMSLPAPDER